MRATSARKEYKANVQPAPMQLSSFSSRSCLLFIVLQIAHNNDKNNQKIMADVSFTFAADSKSHQAPTRLSPPIIEAWRGAQGLYRE